MTPDGFDTTISWSSFKKRKTKPAGKDGDAETIATYTGSNIELAKNGNAVIIKTAEVTVTMNSRASWVVEGKETTSLLKHEQGHYDITSIGAREYYNQLLKLSGSSPKKLIDKVNDLNEAFEKMIGTLNVRYDEQTDHSKIMAEQEKWNKAIATEKQKADGSLDNLP
jgi:hypothetical protein